MAKKINTEETPQTDNNNIPAPEAQAVPVPETASENLGTGGETEDRLPAKTAGKGNAGSEETTEPHILSLLKNSERFVFFAATAGMEYQDFHNKLSNADDALLLFIWDTLGSCIAEATGDIMEKFVETELPGIPHTNRFSPGYCGWHVNEQKLLFSLLPDNVCGITLNSSALMYPIKSISGVIGSGLHVDTRKYGCQFCELDNCYKKRIKKSFNHETQSQSE